MPDLEVLRQTLEYNSKGTYGFYLGDFVENAVSDSTDCTDAFQEAFDAISANNGGFFDLQGKICVITDEVLKDFIGHSGMITIKNGVIRFVRSGSNTPRLAILNNAGRTLFDKIQFYGENNAAKVDCKNFALRVYGSTDLVFRDFGVKALMSDNDSESDEVGLIQVESCANVLFDAFNSGGAIGKGSSLVFHKNCHSVRYVGAKITDINSDKNVGTPGDTKTTNDDPDGRCWLKFRNTDDEDTENENEKVRARVDFHGYMDEAANIDIDAKNVESLYVNGFHANTYVLGGGTALKLDNVINTRIERGSFVDLNENPSKMIEATGGVAGKHNIRIDAVTIGRDAWEIETDGNYLIEVSNSPDVASDLEVIQSADQTFASSTTLADSGLKINKLLPGNYILEADLLIFNGSGYTDHAFGGTATISEFVAEYRSEKVDGSGDEFEKLVTSAGTLYGADSRYNATGANYSCSIKGKVAITATGSFAVQVAQGSSHATGSKMLEGSSMTLIPVK